MQLFVIFLRSPNFREKNDFIESMVSNSQGAFQTIRYGYVIVLIVLKKPKNINNKNISDPKISANFSNYFHDTIYLIHIFRSKVSTPIPLIILTQKYHQFLKSLNPKISD